MNQWDGKERRKTDPTLGEVLIELRFLTEKIDTYHGNLKSYKECLTEEMAKVKMTIYGNGQPGLTTKINDVSNFKKALEDHSKTDSWCFGIIITILLAILAKVIHG